MPNRAVDNARSLYEAGQPAAARDALRRYLTVRPRDLEGACLLAEVLNYLGEHEAALAPAASVARALPHDAHARIVHARVLSALGLDRESESEFVAAEEIAPHAPDVLRARPEVLIRAGRLAEAVGLLRAAIQRVAESFDLLHALCYALNMLGEGPPEEELALHRRLASALARDAGGDRAFANLPDANRPLRIAFLSTDFRRHSCAYFLEPLIESLDPERLTVHLYSAASEADEVTARFRTLGAWRDVAHITPADLADVARSDRIDVLVECNGWTAVPQLQAVASRPAPVQISYLGYPNTTGIAALGWRVVDGQTDPPGAERFCSERLIRVPSCFVCYRPDPESPPPRSTPFMRSEGPPTFGSFNNALKIGPRVVALWSALLTRVPDARLMLKAPGLEGARVERLLRQFEAEGIPRSRLVVRPFLPGHAAHLDLYGEIDLALDTFPYNGTTTTCEAIHMGVPVVALKGDRHRARVGESLLTAAGLPELIAGTSDEYLALGETLGRSPARLANYRERLRGQLLESQLCNARRFACDFADAVREAWRAWGAENPR